MQQVDISKMSVSELKAMGYDLMSEIQRLQNNLQILSVEIAKKQKETLSITEKENGTSSKTK